MRAALKLPEFHKTFACNPVTSILPQYKKAKFNLITQGLINIIYLNLEDIFSIGQKFWVGRMF